MLYIGFVLLTAGRLNFIILNDFYRMIWTSLILAPMILS
jgi:hypothetical protein